MEKSCTQLLVRLAQTRLKQGNHYHNTVSSTATPCSDRRGDMEEGSATSYSIDDPWSSSSNHRANRPVTWGPGSAAAGQNGESSVSLPRHRHDTESDGAAPCDQQLPPIYEQVYTLCQTADFGEDADIPLNQLGKVVRAADGISAADVEQVCREKDSCEKLILFQIINLACSSSSSHCTKDELVVALALIGQVQSGQTINARRARDVISAGSDIPVPSLDLSSLTTSTSNTTIHAALNPTRHTKSSSSSIDPWATPKTSTLTPDGLPSRGSNRPSTLQALENNKERQSVRTKGTKPVSPLPRSPLQMPLFVDPKPTSVHLLPELGGYLFFRHILYLVKSPLCSGVKRRYSDFLQLHEYLLARFPFRLIPPLPPKRLSLPHVNRTQPTGPGQQDNFLEQRKLALARYSRGILSHPVLREDSNVVSFFSSGTAVDMEGQSSQNASSWKGIDNMDTIVEEGLDESWKLSEADIMHVPIDMEEKLAKTREMVSIVLDRWNGVVAVFERQVRRKEASAAESTRLSLALSSLIEAEAQTYQGSRDDSATPAVGVPQGSDIFARSTLLLVTNSQDYADLATARFHSLQHTLDSLKNGRDVWVALKDLFKRYEKLGRDVIPDLQTRIEAHRTKWKTAREERKPGYEEVCSRLKHDIELDQRLIERYGRRNQRVRVALWHEIARLQELSK